MIVDPSTLDKTRLYQLMIGLIVPRPVAWIGSRLPGGADNLAPFSYFMGVQSQPPLLAFSVAHGRDGVPKHTARNVRASGVFTVSLVEEAHLDAMHRTGGAWAESEFDVVGLERAAGARVDAPWVAGARAAMECRLRQEVPFEQTTVFFGEVVLVHLAESLLVDGVLDPTRTAPVARLGGDLYATLGPRITLPRVKVPGS